MSVVAPIAQVCMAVSVGSRPSRVAVSLRKRAFDIVVAGLALLAFLPLLVLIGTAVWMESQGPILFRQQRTGLNGKPFRIYKFRTMTVMEDGDGVRQAIRGDARVTPLGGLLRKLSLDELPQLLNVLKGEMSIVGPRPHALSHDLAWSVRAPRYTDRFRARPGLTGQAQVLGFRGEVANDEGLFHRIDADNEYIDNWSFGRDLALVARTIPLLFGDAKAF
jgi:putative colanic acid biosynthesis UDP-glucose lipid carrier transferase